jgi:hypothetical protein
MMKRIIFLNSLAILMFAIGFNSCKKDDDPEPTPVEYTQINFVMKHVVSDQLVEYDNIQYTNTFGNLYSVSRLQYFISDFTLTRPDGSEIFIDEEHYVDGMVAGTLTFTPQVEIPSGEYTSVSFIFGLSKEKNIPGSYPNPPENNMEWPPALGSGYHYMKLEGKVDSSGVINNFQAHTGPTNGNQNFIEVTLPASSFTAIGSQVTLTIKMDINKWWVNPNTLDLNLITMVMGNQGVQEMLHDNGNDVFSIE